jgi:hypothetical protein
MAVYQRQGTLNPLSTQRAKDLFDAYEASMVLAIAAGKTSWSIVDSNYVNGTTVRTVFVNTEGYAVMMYRSTTLATDGVQFLMGQSYDVGTHTLSNLTIGTNLSTSTSNSTGFSGVNRNPTALATTASPALGKSHEFLTSSAQTAYSIHIEDTWMTLSFKKTVAGNAMFFGKFETLVSNATLTDTYPFVAVNFNNDTVAVMPVVAFLHSLNNNSVTIQHSAAAFTFDMDSTPALPASFDKYSLNPTKAKLSYIYVAREQHTPPITALTNGWLRGYLPGTYHGWVDSAAWGDTVSIDGKAYMLTGGGTATELYNGVAGNHIPTWTEI